MPIRTRDVNDFASHILNFDYYHVLATEYRTDNFTFMAIA